MEIIPPNRYLAEWGVLIKELTERWGERCCFLGKAARHGIWLHSADIFKKTSVGEENPKLDKFWYLLSRTSRKTGRHSTIIKFELYYVRVIHRLLWKPRRYS